MEAHLPIRSRLTLTSANPLVADHRVHGVRTLPGVTFLDIVHRLLAARGIDPATSELRDILFTEPVVTTEEFDREIEVEVAPHGDHHQVTARSRDLRDGRPTGAGWHRHLQARLRLDVPFPAADLALDEVRRRAARQEDVERVYTLGRAAEIRHYPFMKALGTIHHHDGGVLADLALGEEARAGHQDFLLHPALLDASTMQSYALAFTGEESDPRPLIPFHIASFRAAGPLGDACVADLRVTDPVARAADVLHVDIGLHDARGRLVARFERLALKRIRSRELITRLTRPEERPAAPEPPAPPVVPAAAPEPAAGDHLELVRGQVVAAVREVLGDPGAAVETDRGFYELGLESVHLLGLVRALEERWGIELYPTLLFEYTTVDSVAEHLAGKVPVAASAAAPEPAPAPVPDADADAAGTLCFAGEWSPARAAPAAPAPAGPLLVLDEDDDLAGALAATADVVLALPGTGFRRLRPGVYEVRPDAVEDHRRLLADLAAEGRAPRAVVHRRPAPDPAGLPEAVEHACVALLTACRALLETPGEDPLPLLHLAAAATPAAATVPGALAGLAATVRIEQPRLRPTVVELAGPADLAEVVSRELADTTEAWVRHEDGRRLVRRYRELQLDGAAGELPLREGGVYLVGGGSGGLARLFAARLAGTPGARVVLFGRSEPDEATTAALRALGRDGSRVEYVRADVTDAAQVARLVADVRARYGAVHGVVHAAGVLRDALVRHKTADEVRDVLAPKVRGAVHLDEATAAEPLDFFALFSSVTGTVGNAGQADYAAANAFLHAYARHRAAAGRPGRTLALGWPLWADGGMRTDAATEAYFRRHGQTPLTQGPGTAAFLAALRHGGEEFVLFHGDRERVLRSLDPAVPGAPFTLRMAEAHRAPAAPAAAPVPAADRDIAVIGLAGRYPMAADVDRLWENLLAGRDCVTEIPDDRWPREGFFHPERNTPGRSYSRWGGFLADADRFDPHFFQITPREAESMDPQERLFLETVWHTMEDAGYTRERLAGGRVGVFAGVMFNQYQMLGLDAPGQLPMLPTSFSSSVANRVSYFFDFHGPSLALDTMCSSSLTAIHLACQSLLSGECDTAFAGGVNVAAHPYKYLYLSQAGFVSGDGRCRSFGEGGDGYVPGEGVGAVLLKPLAKALADGDRIHGVIKGSAVNHGGRSGGYTVPNPAAQAELVREALERAGVTPDGIGYLEAHGTGTALGDPIELTALDRAFGAAGTGTAPVPIGSVKSNVGHLEPAAGIAGLTKVLLQMRHRTLAPSLHAEPLNPKVDWAGSRFRVQRAAEPWQPRTRPDGTREPLRAGISAFGAGGANGHLIVEEPPAAAEEPSTARATGPYVVVLSARKKENLRRLAERHLERLTAPGAGSAASDVLPRLRTLAAELFGLAGPVLDAGVTLDEWGLDAADLRRFELEIGERLAGEAPRLDLGSTLEEIAGRLAASGAPGGVAPGTPSLAEIAWTTQTGRDALEERLALVVADRGQLAAALRAFLDGREDPARVHHGTVKRPVTGRESEVRRALAERDATALARLWTAGAPVEWRALYPQGTPRRVALPSYPFTRRRCWVRTAGEAAPERPGAEFTYTAAWRPVPDAGAGTAVPGGPVLVLHPAAGRPLAEALAARHAGDRVVLAELGTRTVRHGAGRWQVDAADPAGFAALRDELAGVRTVYVLGGLAGHDPGAATGGLAELDRREAAGVRALFHCVQRLAVPLAGGRDLAWRIVTCGVWSVAGEEVADPYAAGLSGMARVLENEYPDWHAPVIDLPAPLPDADDAGAWARVADLVAGTAGRGTRIAVRDGVAYRQELRPVTLPEPAAERFRTGGTYVVVGGAGGIGLEFARRLAHDHDARVALIGRSPLDEERRARIAEADPDGGRLLYVQADAADPAALRAGLARIHAAFGPVHGVIHSALANTSGLLRNLGEAELRACLAAKSQVAVALAEVFGGEPLDFLLLFSSVQSFLGTPGLANYAAGSTFLDAYAQALDQRVPYPVRSVNWGYWGTVGAVSGEKWRTTLTRQGFLSITPREGWRTVLRALRGDPAQVLALPAEAPLLERLGLAAAEPPSAELPGTALARRAAAPVTDGSPAIGDYHALERATARVAAGRLLRVLDTMGAWPATPDAADADTIAQRTGVVPRYRRLLDEILVILRDAGQVRQDQGRFTPDPGALDACRRADHTAELDRLADGSGPLDVFPRLLALCLGRYPELLRGELLATDLLFPASGMSLMEGVYKGNPISDLYNDTLGAAVLAYVTARVPHLAPGEKIRLLEVGAGTGGTSAGLLTALDPYADHLDYCYTDLSAAFLDHGRRAYAEGRPYLRFKRLDAGRPLTAQGFEAGGYDLVVAANVLHTTRDVERTVGGVKAALRPGGWLVLNELTTVTAQMTLTMGLFDGWWQHDDAHRRLPGSPLLDAPGWHRLLTGLGYEDVVALPEEAARGLNFQHVVVARGDGAAVPEPAGAPGAAEVSAAEAVSADAAGDDAVTRFRHELTRLTSQTSGIALEDLDPDQDLGSFGFDSISYTLLAGRLNETFGLGITPTVFYETATLRALIDKLAADHPEVLRARYGDRPGPQAPAPVPVPSPSPSPERPERAERPDGDDAVVVVGMAGLLPGSDDLDDFWRHLVAGDDLVTAIPADRPAALRALPHRGGFVDGVDRFDPLFFGISPREAEGMDPQQRLLLQTVWAALEDAGIAPGTLAGSDTGLFIGAGSTDYQELQLAAGVEPDAFGATANTHSILVNRVSHLLDLHGPSEPVNTACSSSLVALHRAAEAIRSGACEVAVAGGINVILSPHNYLLLDRTGMLSPDGACKTFDASADGFVRGEGVGLVVLTSARRAARAGHRVRGRLLGSAVNHGGRARSLTAPNPASQAKMLVAAYRRAGVDPTTVGYLETHGTGTSLGDSVEVSGLKTAFAELLREAGTTPPAEPWCALGAVKTTIGHLESAAGIAGVLKVLLAMEHGTLPPSPHVREVNPYLQLDGSPFHLLGEATAWPRRRDGGGREIPRRAGVSSFGYGGVNAHVVLEEPRPVADGGQQPPAVPVFPLSARTPGALRRRAADLAAHLADAAAPALADVAYTLQTGRDPMEHRLAVVARDTAALTAALTRFAADGTADPAAGVFTGEAVPGDPPAARGTAPEELAGAWAAGARVDWAARYAGHPARLVPLPTYPFETTRYWFEEPPAPAAELAAPGAVPSYVPGWTPLEGALPEPEAVDGPVWLAGTEESAATADALARLLAPRQVVRVRLDGPDPVDFDALPAPGAVYFLGGVRRPAIGGVLEQTAELAAGEATGVLAAFRLVRSVLGRPGAGRGLTLTLVTSDACPVAGRPVRNPYQAQLWGFARAVRHECAAWRVAVADLDWDETVRDPHGAARRVLAASAVPGGELAVRDGRAHRPLLRPAARPDAPRDRFRENGLYLITGGAGDIGSDVAGHLVRRYGARVALLGRGPLDAGRRARLAVLDPGGERARYFQGDAADPARLRAVADEAAAWAGRPVDGVLHAANVLRDQALHTADEARFREGLESKTRTTAALVEAFGDRRLDFLLVFSSVQSFLGNPGQSGYAAACTFQDAYAHALAGRLPYPVRVVDWGVWGSSALAERHRERMEQAGVIPIPPSSGLQAMTDVLGQEVVQVAVVSGNERFLAALGVADRTSTPQAAPAQAPAGRTDPDGPWWAERLRADVHALVCEAAKAGPELLRPDAQLSRFGFDSIAYTRLSHTFNDAFGLEVTPAFFFGVATSDELAEKTARSHPDELTAHYGGQDPAAAEPAPTTVEPAAVPQTPAPAPAAPAPRALPDDDAVAVVGMAGRMPQSDDLAEFWAHLTAGDDLVTEIPPDRWNWRDIYGEPADGEFRTVVKWGGFMRGVDEFDPMFFGISPREAEAMDPQHRLFLQAVWSCLDDAAIRPSALAGTDTGVFLGACTYDYFEVQHALGTPLDGYNSTGRAHAVMANRVSYLLDLRGPSETVDTACSSSLVALHRAVEAIRHGDCELAFAGGVQLLASPTLFVDMSQADMLSPNGRCRTFDAAADGIARGEGVGVVLLKRLSAAIADGDVIHGVIRGSAVNHGGRTNSLTAPNPEAQAAVVVKAHRRAGTDPRTVTYVETHGTGTALGDPVEIDGLKSAFATLYRDWGVTGEPAAHCALGAVKSNTGHLEAAAGMAGLLKLLLAMRYGTLPKNLHLETVNPYLRLDGSPFHLLDEARPWLRPRDERGAPVPRRGAVSSFGIGGVNAHVVVEEYLPEPSDAAAREGGPGVFVLSARDADRLREYAARFQAWLAEPPAHVGLDAVTRTVQTGREAMAHRLAIVADGLADLRTKLTRWLDGEQDVAGVVTGTAGEPGGAAQALLDGPEGREYVRMVVAVRKWDKLARLWTAGVDLDWSALWTGREAPRRVPLPAYAFARERYWVRPGARFDHAQAAGLTAAPPEPVTAPDPVPAPEPVTAPEPAPAPAPAPGAATGYAGPSGTAPVVLPDEDAPVVPAGELTGLEERITGLLARHLGVERGRLAPERSLVEYGVDSLGLRRLARALNAEFGIRIPARFFTTNGSVRGIARKLAEAFPAELGGTVPQAAPKEDGADVRSLLAGLRDGRLDVAGALQELEKGTLR
ncbi:MULTISPECIES: SDR family NAD(P)-dependent oxidoreductase [Streptomycetaceae]|uniref:Putative polyketide synthase n=1 Tax=Streptantibioticus cattleyicolor (strain ATCC 35852 / DSM 46488 / JCM 4925 / NBRC 14057 / NRRL 8057) TaxID=1003195 RepID=F8JYE2_STREN|nr:SDR family NAD(P)-dependent oxidoreductase [Streptantibioticus cattleyicolor]AEW95938.1 putative polyketide synthase [Streptantibioticus cattleyicolor NRRL 8057 = DSM 46488]MYS60474.1 SDR family NAD(P)-dependent oxidoreductase [Streptomyces sp. SID5468]CCB76273.1 putative polyketide synthase [Streptantibioticus cattleyicolor NRRL 8057 = DSM 46488]